MKRRVRAIVAVLLTLGTLLGGLVVPPIAVADADQAEMLTVNSLALAITAGPDGNLWFTGLGSNTISRIAPNGTVTGEYRLPTPNSLPNSITVGPDGNLWFTELGANKIGRMATDGTLLNEYPLPTPASMPTSITPGRTAVSGSPSSPPTRSAGQRWMARSIATQSRHKQACPTGSSPAARQPMRVHPTRWSAR